MEAVSPTIIHLIIFVLAIYVGYHVVWTVTPALHTPLMAVTNAISAIVIVGAMLAAALTETGLGKTMGVLAVALAAVNVFGGFLVTRRMLEMFRKKERKSARQACRSTPSAGQAASSRRSGACSCLIEGTGMPKASLSLCSSGLASFKADRKALRHQCTSCSAMRCSSRWCRWRRSCSGICRACCTTAAVPCTS